MDCVLIILGFMVLCFTVQVQGMCGKRQFMRRQPRIIGGVAASKGEVPWIGSLKYDGSHLCGVTIFSKRFLIGAAHCFRSDVLNSRQYDIKKWTVQFGQPNILKKDKMTLFAKIENIIIHPNYTSSSVVENDIAIVKLTEDIVFNAFVQPACLPNGETVEGTIATVAGWGVFMVKMDDGFHFKLPNILQTVHMTVYDNSNCKSVLRKIWNEVTIPEYQICAGWPKGDRYIQPGDSGGGLYTEIGGKWIVAGVTSHNKKNSVMEGDIPGVFTRVSSYTKWIREITSDNEI